MASGLRKLPKLRAVRVGDGLPELDKLEAELQYMYDVLLGRTHSPIDTGVTTLMEVASVFHARASEIAALIHDKERNGEINKSHPLSKFRTQNVRLMLDVCKGAQDLGSRRITVAKMEYQD